MTQSNDTANDKNNPVPQAATTSVVPNQPVETGAAGTAKDDPKPVVDSVLVGKARSAPREPAQPKSAKAAKSSVPVVEAPKAKAEKPVEAAKPVVEKVTPAPAPAPQVVEKVVRKGGFGATFLGGVVAAALGAGAAYYAIPHLPAAWQPVEPAPPADAAQQIDAARAAAAETAKSEVAAAHDQIVADATNAGSQAGSTAGAEAARQALEGQQPVATADLSGIENQLTQQAERIAALDKRLSAAPAATPGQAASTASVASAGSADVQALQVQLQELQGRVAAQDDQIRQLATQPSLDPQVLDEIRTLSAQADQISTAAQSAEATLAAAQTEAQRVQQETEIVGRRAQIVAATATLRMALESGGGLEAGIADLQGSGVTVPPALAPDVPTLPYLQRDFDAAARAGLNASLKANSQGQGAMGAIGNFLRVQTGARSVEPRDGTDPDAILSRAGAAVQRGDVKSALAEIATLPPAGQDAMVDWTTGAQKWVAAAAAIDEIAASAK